MRHPLSHIYHGMKHRCYGVNYPEYKRYGGRGIRICERWLLSFKDFCEDMGQRPTPKHSIERKDNNGNYEPGNCVWATATEQARNRRSSNMIEAFGERKSLAEWAETSPVSYHSLKRRIRAGWEQEKALTVVRRDFPDVRTSYNKQLVSVGEETRTVKEWRDLNSIPHRLFWQRMHVQKWSIEDACTTPIIAHGLSKDGESCWVRKAIGS